ncbi:MAG TPA: crossover junction endodeoxyribonuclease RuvC [Acidimicrobiales bacterium]|nr:crossover junction endodeoxyribonuclease RuvC [Acidimicrobiales bacterium]
MFVLGIDPGLSRCGFGGVTEEHGEGRAVAAGVITSDPARPVPERLAELHGEIDTLLTELHPDVVAVERVFFQTNARTAMAVGQASGVALLAAAEHGCGIVEYTSNEVKLAVAGYGAADKVQVQQMVARLLHLTTVPDPPDVADALALALCHLAARRRGDLLSGAVAVRPATPGARRS